MYTMIYKTLHKKQTTEQHEISLKTGWTQVLVVLLLNDKNINWMDIVLHISTPYVNKYK
jgi:hypothetical protein